MGKIQNDKLSPSWTCLAALDALLTFPNAGLRTSGRDAEIGTPGRR